METRTRKSTALISLVLVPLNLLGLGFAGCDSRDDDPASNFASATDGGGDASADGDDAAGFDFEDPSDPFNLDPVDAPPGGSAGTGPVAYPSTQPLAQSSFAALPPNHVTHYYHSGPHLLFLPIPYRTTYQPPYRAPFRTSSSSVFRSSPSRSSGVSRSSSSSGTSHGGFGSSAASHSASS